MERLYAVRGATTVDRDDRGEILGRTQVLLEEILGRNGIRAADVVSIVFTATDDLHAEFPAAAARTAGLDEVPRLCARELDVDSDLRVERCIRVLMHYYGAERPEHVYLEGATRILDVLADEDG